MVPVQYSVCPRCALGEPRLSLDAIYVCKNGTTGQLGQDIGRLWDHIYRGVCARIGRNKDLIIAIWQAVCKPAVWFQKVVSARNLMIYVGISRVDYARCLRILQYKDPALVKRTGRMRGVWSLNPGGTSSHSLSGRRAILLAADGPFCDIQCHMYVRSLPV